MAQSSFLKSNSCRSVPTVFSPFAVAAAEEATAQMDVVDHAQVQIINSNAKVWTSLVLVIRLRFLGRMRIAIEYIFSSTHMLAIVIQLFLQIICSPLFCTIFYRECVS